MRIKRGYKLLLVLSIVLHFISYCEYKKDMYLVIFEFADNVSYEIKDLEQIVKNAGGTKVSGVEVEVNGTNGYFIVYAKLSEFQVKKLQKNPLVSYVMIEPPGV